MLPPRTLTSADILAAGGLPLDFSQLTTEQYAVLLERVRKIMTYAVYWGTSQATSLDAAGVVALKERFFEMKQTGYYVREAQDGQPAAYLYFAYPALMGGYLSAAIRTTADGAPINLDVVSSVVQIADDVGVTRPYYVVRSSSKVTGPAIFSLLSLS